MCFGEKKSQKKLAFIPAKEKNSLPLVQ